MSIWGKVIGGVAGFALGGPLGGLLGAVAGHAVDRMRGGRQAAGEDVDSRQIAFTVAVIALSAKMAKADGRVTREEIDAFKHVFNIPTQDMKNIGRLFDEARKDASNYEPYAQQIADMFADEPVVLEELLGCLFHIAKADGVVHEAEVNFLKGVAGIFGFDAQVFEHVRAAHTDPDEADPYLVLGIARDATVAEIKKTYRKLIRENHPDTLIARGMPQELIDVANEKMANINAAYDRIEKERGFT